ncbi:hypothetical protein [Mycolicibacterium sphagni]|uniref:Uncharacterized protein n=1 Tax=Mycolicibacterium sphagni TaxID=1786 RepID=A0A255DMW3_9MYCO|nr:hypothetical protein [Mycolicibacterium sphagni]OYN80430.1 hypothetical protein CG716_09900 [Mycolicibacterium sphagni]
MPAQKKHPSTRRRRNKASSAAVLEERDDDDDIEDVEIPELPPRLVPDDDGVRRVVDWCPETLDWWDDVWLSPMAGEYLDADIHGLVRLAALIDNYWRDPCAKTHAEVRLAQKDYGLTPYDRRRLEWTIASAKKATAGGQGKGGASAAPTNPQPAPETDPRLALENNVVAFPQAQ